MSLMVRPARVEDAAPFAAQLRAEDFAEFQVAGDPAEVLAAGIKDAWRCYLGYDESGPVCVFGVQRTGSLLDGVGYLWCGTTPRVLRHKRRFLLGSRAWVASARLEFDMLTGWCAMEYAVSVRWLTRWLGFTLGERTVIGGVPFVNFHWWRET